MTQSIHVRKQFGAICTYFERGDQQMAAPLDFFPGAFIPPAPGTDELVLYNENGSLKVKEDDGTVTTLIPSGIGDVFGPSGATDNAIARYVGVTPATDAFINGAGTNLGSSGTNAFGLPTTNVTLFSTSGLNEITDITLPAGSTFTPGPALGDYFTINSPASLPSLPDIPYHVWFEVLGVPEITSITMPMGSTFITGALVPGDYFLINSTTANYHVWFEVDGGPTVDPSVTSNSIKVNILSTDSATTVAIKTAAAIDATGVFSVPVPTTPTLIVTNVVPGDVVDASDGFGSGAIFVTLQQGINNSADPNATPNPIKVTITSADSATTVAIATAAAINSVGGAGVIFTVPVPTTPTITVTNTVLGAVLDAAEGVGSGATFVVTQQGSDDKTLEIGLVNRFIAIIFDLDTVASASGIAPIFEFSDGVGGWRSFTPVDGTNGFTTSGTISWDIADICSWVVDSVNGVGPCYWIRISRTATVLTTPPIENIVTLQVASVIRDSDLILSDAPDPVLSLPTGDLTLDATAGSLVLSGDSGILNLPVTDAFLEVSSISAIVLGVSTTLPDGTNLGTNGVNAFGTTGITGTDVFIFGPGPPTAEITIFVLPAGSFFTTGAVNGDYFTLSSPTLTYHVWFEIVAGGPTTDPGITGNPIKVTVLPTDTATMVAIATAAAINEAGGGTVFTSPVPINPGILVINQVVGSVLNPVDIGTLGVAFLVNQEGSDNSLVIGHEAIFTRLFVTLISAAVTSMLPRFEYSDGSGSWIPFTPTDGTVGFTASGTISWEVADVISWKADTINSISSRYWIRISRTEPGSFAFPLAGIIEVGVVNALQITATDPTGGIDFNAGATSGPITMDAGGGISIDAGAASNFTTTSGLLTLDGGGGIDLEGNAGDINVTTTGPMTLTAGILAIDSSDDSHIIMTSNDPTDKTMTFSATNAGTKDGLLAIEADGAITIDSTSGGISIDGVGGNSNFSVTSGDLTLNTVTTGDIFINSVGNLDMDSVGTLSVNSSGGDINIGNDNVDVDINIGTAGARAISVGSGSTTSLDLNSGTGPMTISAGTTVDLDSGFGAGALSINSSGSEINIGNDSVTGDINIGTSGNRAITVGNASADSMALEAGVGNLNIRAEGTISINSPGIAEITEVTVPAGGTFSTATGPADYFTINSPTVNYYVWFDVTNIGSVVDPLPGGTGIEVNILSTNSALQVAVAAAAAMAAVDSGTVFSVPVPTTSTFTVTNLKPGVAIDAAEGVSSGATFNVTQQGVVSGINIGNDNDDSDINIATGGARIVTIGNPTEIDGFTAIGGGLDPDATRAVIVDRDFTASGGTAAGTNVLVEGAAVDTINNTYTDLISNVKINAPNIILGSEVAESSSTIYISEAPYGNGISTTDNYSLLVDSGDARFDSDLFIGSSNTGVPFQYVFRRAAAHFVSPTVTLPTGGTDITSTISDINSVLDIGNDNIYFGSDKPFFQVNCDLSTPGVIGSGSRPRRGWYYFTQSGSFAISNPFFLQPISLIPTRGNDISPLFNDTTRSFTKNGIVSWTSEDVVDWAKTTLFGISAYWILSNREHLFPSTHFTYSTTPIVRSVSIGEIAPSLTITGTLVESVETIETNTDPDLLSSITAYRNITGTNISVSLIDGTPGQIKTIIMSYQSTAEVTQIRLPAGSTFATSGNADYFTINSTTVNYYVWFNVTDTGTEVDPTPGGTGIQVDILSSDTAATVASKTRTAINTLVAFSVPAPSFLTSTIRVTNAVAGAVPDAAEGVSSGAEIIVLEHGGSGDVVITPTSAIGYTTITLNSIGDSVILKYFSSNIEAVITNISETGTPTTITTLKPHGFLVGDTVTISGVNTSPTDLNGSFTIATTPTSNTFTITINVTTASDISGTAVVSASPGWIIVSNFGAVPA